MNHASDMTKQDVCTHHTMPQPTEVRHSLPSLKAIAGAYEMIASGRRSPFAVKANNSATSEGLLGQEKVIAKLGAGSDSRL